ncbi:putative phosphohistidine phosphatase SixA [Moraxella macacae 0408225]|uniref:Putative phosphohistidine phosphatase SixA n=1 Tax=Moraxella macacae 0408225 TaxID=1230338 RepID=L2F603_9GAMM|nr:phosphohistidine phosphatase SixA [Moraxella macacae]ELA08462.1 putative phosphohistidine phosphatase SixA [Moraxella macacae 0408225]
MKIILIRHGDAGAYTHPDNERNLSELGKTQACQSATWLENWTTNHTRPTLFISSPYNRAVQTCAIIKQNFANIPYQVFDNITPNDDANIAINKLSDLLSKDLTDKTNKHACVVIVSHMNIIAEMAGILTGQAPQSFSLAEVRVLKTDVFAPDLATEIERFIPN